MNLAPWFIENKVFSYVLTFVLIVGGFYCYSKLGRLEDPEFTIKEALITTAYPGATPFEVEQEVTEVLETAIQQLGQLKEIYSISKPGLSIITAKMKDKYDSKALPQIWDELRRKVNDAQNRLPPGAKPSIVNDDFGDVYGVLMAITATDDLNYAQIKEYADYLKRELSLVKDVAKVVLWGVQQEQIFVEISRAKLAQLGVDLNSIYSALKEQNFVVESGKVRVDNEYIAIRPTGYFSSIEEIENLIIQGEENKQIYLKDLAKISRDFIEPPTSHARYNGQKAIALGISTVSGGNVVTMGDSVLARLTQLDANRPIGMDLNFIYYQAQGVQDSVNSFLVNLIEAVIIVVVVLMLFMGLRSGLLIGAVLVLTVSATFVVMYVYAIDLQRISLGALIIALGMLVDNAIVVTDGILVRFEKKMPPMQAVKEVVGQSTWPLFGATLVAILAFAAIGLSDDSTGEYTRSLFQVLLISLGLSWVIAITLTPLYCVMFLKQANNDTPTGDPYKGALYTSYKKILEFSIKNNKKAIFGVFGLLAAAIFVFGLLEDSFFPDSTSKIILAHYWAPEGTDIRKTSKDVKKIAKHVSTLEGVESVATFIGQGAPRFMLVYSPEKQYDSYGLLLITVNDYKKIDGLMPKIEDHIRQNYLDANPKLEKIRLGPGGGFLLEARFKGTDPDLLRSFSQTAQDILIEDGGATGIRDDWRQRVKIIKPEFLETQARRVGVTRTDVANALQAQFSGLKVGLYREDDDLIPIVTRPPKDERESAENIYDLQVWSNSANTTIPIRQVVQDFPTSYEDAVVQRRDKKRTVTTQADPKTGNVSVLFARVKEKIESIPLPIGYEFEWGGEYKNSNDAKQGLMKSIPTTILLMVLVTIWLFNSLRQPMIIWLTVPLAIIGVAFGLFLTGQSFGFMALLGFLSLTGMLIKNAIVLLDEIDLQIKSGKDKYLAVVDASVSRFRPVLMAAATTILGMLPLLTDVFFVGMAVTIMFGLAFATCLTLIIVPVFYVTLYRIKAI